MPGVNGKHDGRVAIVTGATKGIGQSIARELAASGVTVVVTGRCAADAQREAEALAAAGTRALGARFDIEQRGDIATLVDATLGAFGRLDILVNNALSKRCVMPPEAMTDDDIEQAFTANITNTFLLTRLARPHLAESGNGRVINIGSVVVNRHLLGLPLYGIVKAAVVHMTRVLAAEWAGDGIRVNAINPGFIRTSAFADLGMPDELIERSYEFYSSYHPLGKIGEPADIGRMAAYLVSAAADLISGAVIEIDGGYSTQGLQLYSG